jgi:ATP-dependent Clp protease adaptor protein ClpS
MGTKPQTVERPETTTIERPVTDFVTMDDAELEKPFRVIIENDDVTPMEFVVLVLQGIFGLSSDQAFFVMLEAHYNGRAHVVTLPYEEARQRVYDAQHLAREAGYPLSFYLEPDE